MKLNNKNISPINYQIQLFLEEGEKFQGTETITFNVLSKSEKIELNAKNINITKAKINDQEISLNNISNKNDILSIACDLNKGENTLKLEYNAKYGHVTGLYRSNYKNGFIYSTQFEAAHAREVFPCIDEPAAKATFDLKLKVPKEFDAISNTNITKKESTSEHVTYTFATSLKMSTYLLYIGAGNFEYLEETYQGKRIRIVTTPGKSKNGVFALEATKKFLTFYENYFGIQYPLQKLDMIAVPDFGSGAMENWGAITFREDALLFDQQNGSLSAKQRVAEVISHELVHQWFGNLVTMQWWNDLWLNESFADYMAYKAVAKFYPEMDPWSHFLGSRVNGAYFLDALNNSHAINVKVESPAQIREVFDAISYSKGGMVLRMLESFIGEETFRKGLHAYLEKYSYANAQGNDLWEEISKFTDKPVQKMMDNWLNQMGYPIITVQEENGKTKLSQERFQYINRNDNKKWLIPIATQNDYLILDEKSIELDKNISKINKGEVGFYRVHYPDKLFQKILSEPNSSNIDIWGLHNDSFALMLAKKITVQNYLNYIELYTGKEFIVVEEILSNLRKLLFLTNLENVKKVTSNFCDQLIKTIGWHKKENEKEIDGTIRSSLIYTSGMTNNAKVLDEASTLFKKFCEDKNSVDPDLRSSVFKLAARDGNMKTYTKLYDLYKNSNNPQEKVQLLSALACFKDTEILKKSLSNILTPEVRHQNIIYFMANLALNPNGKDMVWPWIKNNWQELEKIYAHYTWHFNSILNYLSLQANPKLGEQIQKFLDENPLPGTQRALAQMREKMEVYANFINEL